MVKFLLIRFSSIGDIVLTTPVIRCLKNQVGGAEIHFLTKKQFKPVIDGNPYLTKIHLLEDSLKKLISEIKKEEYHYLIDLHHNLRTSVIKNRLRIMSFSVNKINLQKWLMVNLKKNRLPRRHIVDRYLETVRLFDVQNDGAGLDYFIPGADEVPLKSLPPGFRDGYIALVAGAGHATKQLPLEKLISLCRRLDRPVLLMGGPDDRALGEAIHRESGPGIHNACGAYSISQSASLIRQSRVVITPDTGLMHIAAAFHKKILSLWGNTIPEFGMSPYLPDPASRIYEIKDLYCRPCSKIGYSNCPKKHFRCMNELDETDIAREALALFDRE